ncbi:patatin-like phospholipase family protein [Calothrix sp. CCY 0018]|uniref:patatin-like phospholipase family protein n=1 Tax=Calothrix sp. CCY 0018 TaxID=3103864 RepID=UPI0039C63C77
MPFRILSLDGGGVRGIVAAKMLANIEKRIDRPLNQYFDLIVGTSTGSIVAAAIATGRNSEDIVDFFQNKSSSIFPYQSLFSPQRIPLLLKYGISAPKYSDNNLIQVLQGVFGETRLLDIGTSPRLLIVSYDTIERNPIIFKSWRPDKPYGNVPLWEVCVASASAPTYFPAHKLDKRVIGNLKDASINTIIFSDNESTVDAVYENAEIRITDGRGSGQVRVIKNYIGSIRKATVSPAWDRIPDKTSTYSIKTIYSAIDGGVAANNPSSCGIAEALRVGYSPQEISVLSIGTGERTRIIPYEKARSWGLLQWAQPIVGVLFDASSDIYHYISKHIVQEQLLRLQFKLDKYLTGKPLSDDLDDATEENINNLLEAADAYMNLPEVKAKVDRFLKVKS